MPSQTVQVDWLQGQSFLLKDRFNFPIVMTQPMGVNGSDLLPLSLIGCAAWDVLSILQKQRQQVTALQVTATCEQDAEPPWRYRKIHIIYRFQGYNVRAQAVERAIELAETKYCSIYATLRDCIQISSEYHLEET